MRYISAILLLCIIVPRIAALKILVFSPKFGHSHVTFAGTIADLLMKAGHRVVVLLYDMNPDVKTNGTQLAKIVVIPAPKSVKKIFNSTEMLQDVWTTDYNNVLTHYENMNNLGNLFTRTCMNLNAQHHILDPLKMAKFDLAVAEVFDACAFGIIEYLKIPNYVATSSSVLLDDQAKLFGVPRSLSHVPSIYSYSSDTMNIYQRFWNLINSRIAEMYHEAICVREQQVFNQLYGDKFVDLNEKIAKSTFLFLNTNPLYDFPRPTLPKIIPVGGINVKKAKQLSKEWKTILLQRPHAMVVAFGSVAKSCTMPAKMKQSLLKAFAQFPNVTFIWRYEKAENIAKGYDNVVVADWIPQNDLLNDEQVIGAVTHGGINGIHEAIYAGKPLIVVPLFAEQSRNAKMVERAKIGIILDKNDLFYEAKITAAFKAVVQNENRLRTNAKEMSLMVQSNPENVHQKVVKYIEFAAKFNGLPLLDNIGRKQSAFVYYFMDLAVIFILVYFAGCITVIFLVRSYIIKLLGIEIRLRRFHKKRSGKINKKQQ